MTLERGAGVEVKKPLRLRVSRPAERHIRSGHPWLFSNSILEINRPGSTGDLAVIYDHQDRFLALGLFEKNSPFPVRLLHVGAPVQVTSEWWLERLRSAWARRDGLFTDQTTGYRLVNGESDGWPGVVMDRYGDHLVLKLYSAAWLERLPDLLGWIQALEPAWLKALVLRVSRKILPDAQRAGFTDGSVLIGEMPKDKIWFLENGLQFEADVVKGQKTGTFLDQRENRAEVEKLSRGRGVLNVFSFNGGFSLYAARGGASHVTDLDISRHALEASQRQFFRNFPQDLHRHSVIQADAFDWFAERRAPAFDLIVVDPPSLAKKETERSGALEAYSKINAAALAQLKPGGILVACSCSAHVSREEFFDAIVRMAKRSGKTFRELQRRFQPPDHPASFQEAQYLKSLYLQV